MRGVAPVQYPVLKSVTSDPVVESAEHTTPPMRRTASIPSVPRSPIRTEKIAEIISVVSVIPETGVMLIVATAHDDTAAKRKATTSVMRRATSASPVAPSYAPRTANLK